MSRLRRVLFAVAFGVFAPILPAVTHAGGGVGGGGFAGGASVQVDNVSPPGHNWGYLDYFPRNAVVQQGQTVTFTWARNNTEPHTVTFVPGYIPFGPSSERFFNKLYPGNNGPSPDTDDHPVGLTQNINVRQPVGCGNSPYFPGTGACPWDGRSPVSSGLLYGAKGAGQVGTWTVRMNAAPGVYHYFCLIHGPDMSGTIRVLPAGAATPSAAQQAAARSQYHWATVSALAHVAQVSAGASRKVGGHTTWIVHAGDQFGRVAIDEYLPAHVNARPGDTVLWTPGFHTVTFPSESGVVAIALDCERPGGDRRAVTANNPEAANFAGCLGGELAFDRGFIPSGPPGRPYTGGFYNSGNLVVPKVRVWTVSFPSGGTFHYDCLIHPGMDAAISVH